MGIFPYFTEEEHKLMDDQIRRYDEFVKEKGYKSCYQIDPLNTDRYLKREGFTASNGVCYKTADDMHQGYGFFPLLEKDGVCYGYDEPRRIHNYVDPVETESK